MQTIIATVVIALTSSSCVVGSGLTNDPLAAAGIHRLDGQWTATLKRDTETLLTLTQAQVPGDLITDLEKAGHIGDPLYELNFKNATLWDTPKESGRKWTYSTTFSTEQVLGTSVYDKHNAESSDVLLVFDGIKMGATIFLNGKKLGQVTDQFLRYNFSVGNLLTSSGSFHSHADKNLLEVSFDGTSTNGRFMACTGGWDWGPYSNTFEGVDHTFSKGIWKSVYLASIPKTSAYITHLVPHTFYRGSHVTVPLQDGTHAGFDVHTTTFLRGGSEGSRGTLTISANWGGADAKTSTSTDVTLSPHEEKSYTLKLVAEADQIKLWWPTGLADSHPLYNVTATFNPQGKGHQDNKDSSAISASRALGFRVVAMVTGNDTDPAYVKTATGQEGSDDHGLYIRVNGAAILARGGNVIPMDNMEGRYSAEAHKQMVASAADGRMNILRIWGGGIFLPDAFYDEADRLGMLVYHDLMYTTTSQTHIPQGTPTEAQEIRHNLRRLSHHPSIIVWNACNECGGGGLYTSFAMTIVADTDQSRPIWPSCPSSGWGTGTRKLDSLPTGSALSLRAQKSSIERHGPYANGNGWQAVNQAPFIPPGGTPMLRPTRLPVPINITATGLGLSNQFTSEFGASVFSSFESMAPTLAQNHWGVHGGAPEDNCSAPDLTNPFWKDCKGGNVMAERNYPCDNLIIDYFGEGSAGGGGLDDVGEQAFQRQLWQCMISQALAMQSDIETRRSINTFGIMTWQLNEIWPTGGWGSLEYGTTGFTKGQVIGGRWRPLHHFMRQHLFTDVFATCGLDGVCVVKNDAPRKRFAGVVEVKAIHLKDGAVTPIVNHSTVLPAGPGASEWFQAGTMWDSLASSGNYVFECNVIDSDAASSAAIISSHVILAGTPSTLAVANANVTTTVAEEAAVDNTVEIRIEASAPALYVTLTTEAQGRFSENAFIVSNNNASKHQRVVYFIPFGKLDLPLLKSSLRVEHLSMYV